ncbi:MAG: phosphohistidine phosphatase SixA [Candidatus Sedimenticola sp. 6PFRAG5]
MKLYLVQHGEALSKEVDPDRPLSEQGKSDVQSIAAFLKQANIRVEQVFHSGKSRALETAEILSTALYSSGAVKRLEGINPNDDIAPFAQSITTWKADSLVVGHLPFMSRVVSTLLIENTDQELVSYMPGSLVCLERNEAGQWRLAWMIRPELFRHQ